MPDVLAVLENIGGNVAEKVKAMSQEPYGMLVAGVNNGLYASIGYELIHNGKGSLMQIYDLYKHGHPYVAMAILAPFVLTPLFRYASMKLLEKDGCPVLSPFGTTLSEMFVGLVLGGFGGILF